jgi:predicted aminopeptidase
MEQNQVAKIANASQSAITPSASVGSNNFTDLGHVSEVNGCNNVSTYGDVTNADLSHLNNTAVVNATSQMPVNQDSLRELSLPSFSDSNQQCVATFLQDLDMYFEIKQVPENLKLSHFTHY